MAQEGRGRGCLKAGCCGCGALALALAMVAGGFGLAGWSSRPGPPEWREEAQTVVAGGPAAATGETSEQTAPGESSAAVEAGTAGEAPTPRKPGLLRLELDVGKLTLVPGPEGTDLAVDARYDAATHELVNDVQQLPNGTWTADIALRPRGGLVSLLFAGNREEPDVVVHVPRDLPVTLRATLSKGESSLELGGLTLDAVSVQASMGEHALAFSEPTRGSLASFELHSRMGEVRVEQLGNASPAHVDADHAMGELRLDLSGAWRNGSDVRVRGHWGEVTVVAPPEVPLQVVSAHVDGGELSRSPGFGKGEVEPGQAVRLDAAVAGGGLVLTQ